MTTIRQIVTDALREANVVAVGGSPEADVLDEAVRRLQNLYRSLFGYELGEQMQPWTYGTNGLTNSYAKALDMSSDVDSVFVPSNIRLILNIDETSTLYLNPEPEDGARFAVIDNGANLATYNVTLNGNGRKIELTNTVTLNTNSLNREWFYRADLGNWARVTDLDADAESPLPAEFDDFLITLLAFRLNPRYGAKNAVEMIEVLKRMRKQFRARYRQTNEQTSEDGLLHLSSNYRGYYGTGVYNRIKFNRGF